MIICPNCHTQLEDNAAFCHMCGAQLAQQNYAPQQGYPQQPYTPNPYYSQPAPVQPKKKNKGLVIGIVAGVLVVLAAIGSIAQTTFQKMGYDDGSEDVRGEVISGDNAADPTESLPEFSMGKAENGIYKNDFLGLTCTVPAGWEFYTDEQIREMNNFTADFYDEEFAEQIQNATIIYDMLASNAADGSSINVNLEKLNPAQMLILDVKKSLEAQIDTIKSTYENMGYTNTQVQYQKVTVDGQELDGLMIKAQIQGIDLYCTLFSFTKGSYMANVSVTTTQADTTSQILGYFTFD